MTFDYYAFLAEQKACPKQLKEAPDPKNEARQCYMKLAAKLELKLPPDLHLEPDNTHLPDSSWFGIDVSFMLETPWYSRDERPFHVLDNPVRKDRVFGVPFMSAASWKGLLRWACRIQAGLSGLLETHDMKIDGWKDPSWVVHLFGNEKGEEKDFQSGALAFYPTWFDKVDFGVINPHSRARRAGTQPIYYEVVPASTNGQLRLLYAPLPGEVKRDDVIQAEVLSNLVDAIEDLLQKYGISAKRTVGWGATRIDKWTGFLRATDEPTKVEPRFKKKTLHSLQELGSLASKQTHSGSFTSENAQAFKKNIKSRFAASGGAQ